MTASNILACFNETTSFEGGYVDNPHDPGGATMAGVTQAAYTNWLEKQGKPNAPVKNSTPAEREAIYRAGYWDAVRGDDLYAGLDLVVVDTGWGSGPLKAIELLQQALGITADGKIGPQTLDVLKVHENSTDLINAVCNRRMAFFRGLSTWKYFGKGWTVRLNGIQGKALSMNAAALKATTPIPSVKPAPEASPPANPSPVAAAPAKVAPPEAVAAVQASIGRLTNAPAHLTIWEKIKAALEMLEG